MQWFGKNWTNWGPFAAELRKRGIDPYTWATQHPQAAVQIGAPYAITTVSGGGQGAIHTTTPAAFNPGAVPRGTPVMGGAQANQQVLGPGGRPVMGTKRGPPGSPPYVPGVAEDATGYDSDGDGTIDTPWEGTDGAGNLLPSYGDPGGGVAAPPATPQIDWSGADFSGMLGIAGLPADVIAKVTDIFRRIPDPGAAAQVALGYIRGTPWYAQTFVGINFGLQKGLFNDEAGYRDYRNGLTQVYQQWAGRAPDTNELSAALQEGVTPELVGRRFQGRAIADVNRADIQFLTGNYGTSTDLRSDADRRPTRATEDEVQALGAERAGIGTVGGLGLKVERAAALASARLQRAFEGTAASPQLALRGSGRPFAPGLERKLDLPA